MTSDSLSRVRQFRGRGHADDRCIQVQAAGRAVELCTAVAEDAAVAGDLPIAGSRDGLDGDHENRVAGQEVGVGDGEGDGVLPEMVGVPLRVPSGARRSPGGSAPPLTVHE